MVKYCLICLAGFERVKGTVSDVQWKNRLYCSLKCSALAKKNKSRRIIGCIGCGVKFFVPQHMSNRKFCSRKCKEKNQVMFSLKGDKAPNWQGGITEANNKIRHSREYREWRKLVFEKDKYTCQNCFKVGGILNADHIKSFAIYKELRLNIDNGRTLCIDCHKKTPTYAKNVKYQ